MNSLTVRSRLLIGFGVMVVFLVAMLGFSIYEQSKLAELNQKQYKHPFMVTNAVSRADGNIVRMSRLMKDIAMVKDDAEIVKLTQQVDALEQKVLDDLTFAKSRYLTSPEEMEKLIQLFKTWKPIRDQVIALKREGKGAEAGELTRTSGGPKLVEIFSASQKIYDTAMKKADSFQQMSADAHTFSAQMTLLFGVVMLLLAGFMALTLTRSITRQLGGEPADVVNIANQLASGNLASVATFKTEEGSALHAVMRLKGVLHDVLSESNQVVSAMAKGDFSRRVTGQYAGELENLKQGMNITSETVATMMRQLSELMKGLHAGRFNTKLDISAEGVFREVSDLAMATMNKLNTAIGEINQVMSGLNDGDFSARVRVDVQGDLLQMKDAINHSLETLDHLTNDLVQLANAQLNGDLTQHASGTYKGRFKALQDARSASTDKIKTVIAAAMETAVGVTEAATQVAQGSNDLSARVQQQASALEETSATMNQMATAVQANTANAHRVAGLAHDVQHQANEGAVVMQQTIGAMQSIQESSHKIADIVSLIDGIAFQTNLLALNAAVEAARAGEHGRGFAVVASEVRALAQKSADAAKDIKTLIDDSVSRVENGTQLAQKSGEMLSVITRSVEQVAGMIEEIATASNEQSSGIGQVHQAISNIDAVTQQNAALVEETTAAAESLNNEANTLHQNMSFFNIGRDMRQVRSASVRSVTKAVPATKKVSAALPAPTDQGDTWGEF